MGAGGFGVFKRGCWGLGFKSWSWGLDGCKHVPFFLLSSCSLFLFFELVGAGGFGVFKGGAGDWGLNS